MVEPVSLGDTPVLLSLGGKTTSFTVLVNWVGNPVDAGITTDSLVRWAAQFKGRYLVVDISERLSQ